MIKIKPMVSNFLAFNVLIKKISSVSHLRSNEEKLPNIPPKRKDERKVQKEKKNTNLWSRTLFFPFFLLHCHLMIPQINFSICFCLDSHIKQGANPQFLFFVPVQR